LLTDKQTNNDDYICFLAEIIAKQNEKHRPFVTGDPSQVLVDEGV